MDFNFDVEIEKVKSGERGREIKQEKLLILRNSIVESIEFMKTCIRKDQKHGGQSRQFFP